MRDSVVKSTVSAVLWCTALSMCGQQTPPNDPWPATAAVAANLLRSDGMVCSEEGRELYPLIYECVRSEDADSAGIYLYADDRNGLEGIRVFSRRADDSLFRLALRVAFAGQMPTTFEELDISAWERYSPDTWIVESGGSAGLRYLRITPKNRVASN